ncbi:MAG: hypothetical protein ACRCU2_30040, partial [Planktothrix sp.]
DRLLLSGEAVSAVARYCRDRAFPVSDSAVQRHTKHIVGYAVPPSHELIDYGIKRENKNPDLVTFDLPDFENPENLSESIIKTFQILIAGIEARSRIWAGGKGRFPGEEIKSLKSYAELVSLLKQQTNFLNLDNTFEDDFNDDFDDGLEKLLERN